MVFEEIAGPSTTYDRRRGRPERVPDGVLAIRRRALYLYFDHLWCDIGVGLETLYRRADVPKVLKPLEIFDDPLAELLTLKLRSSMIKRIERALGSYDAQRAGQILAWADRRPTSTQSDFAEKAARRLQKDPQLLRCCKAFFAQQELANMCGQRSALRRYEITPWNLSCALAGSPNMGWRKSMQRCLKLIPKDLRQSEIDGSRYSTFRLIASLLKYLDKRKPKSRKTRTLLESIISEWLRNAHSSAEDSLHNLRINKGELIDAMGYLYKSKTRADQRPYTVTRRYFFLVRDKPTGSKSHEKIGCVQTL